MIRPVLHDAELTAPMDRSFVSLALATAARLPGQTALIDAPDGRIMSYGELADKTLRVASSLTRAGLRPGDVVATFTPNSSSWVLFALGVMAARGIVTGINPMLKPNEITRQISTSGATILAVASTLLPLLEGADLDKRVKEIIVLDAEAASGHKTLADLVRAGEPEPRMPKSDDVALLPFSSGTSGMPKGVEVTGRSLALSGANASDRIGLRETDTWLAVAPFFHIVAVSGVLASAFAAAATVVIAPTPDFEAMLAAIERYRVTVTVLTPPAVRGLAEHPAIERYDLSSLRAVGCTAAPLSAELQEAAGRRIGVPIFQAYGMTETVGAVTLGPIADPRPGSCGKVAPGVDVRIVDPESGDAVGTGAPGEIWVCSDMLMRGYHDDPAATEQALTSEGWLRTGDLGYLDKDGYLFVVDRLKELIKVGSAQVAPAELEATIGAYPGVVDVAVVGRPSPATGECPVAYVVAPDPFAVDGLMTFVAERVAPFKRLHAVELVDAIPRQPNGKIMRRLLRERERAFADRAPGQHAV